MNKSILFFCILLLLCILFGACTERNAGQSDPYTFPGHTGDENFDSLLTEFQRSRYSVRPGIKSSRPDSLLNILIGISSRHPDNLKMKYRVRIAAEFLNVKNIPNSERKDRIERYLSGIDSASYPVEYNLMLLPYATALEDYSKSYETAYNAANFFEKNNAPFYQIQALNVICNILWLINQPEAAETTHKIISILRNTGMEEEALRHEVNLGWSLSDSLRRPLLAKLRKEPYILQSPVLLRAVMLASYSLTDSVEYLDTLISKISSESFPTADIKQSLLLIKSFKGEHLILHGGNPQEALDLIRPALMNVDSMTESRFRVGIYRYAAQAYHAAGMYDSAAYYYNIFEINRDSLFDKMDINGVNALRLNEKIARLKIANQVEEERRNRIFWNVIMTLIAVASVVAIIIARKNEKRKQAKILIEEELKQTRFKLIGKQILLQEKEQWISTLSDCIKELKDDRTINESQATSIMNKLRLYRTGATERENINQLYEKLDPGFYKRIKRQFPALTEAQLKFAGYLVIGMTSGQIGRLLNIAPQSVKTKRWRLRQALGIKKGESLEDFLRQFSH